MPQMQALLHCATQTVHLRSIPRTHRSRPGELTFPDGDRQLLTKPYCRTDPQTEIQKIRQSLYLLEAALLNRSSASKQPSENGVESLRQSSSEPSTSTSPRYPTLSSSPAALDAQTGAGLYAGPTSSATHLFGLKVCP
jgi:hypothetical protein